MLKGNPKEMTVRYQYRVAWEEEDRVFVARVAEWPSLAAHGDTMEAALAELRGVVEECIVELWEEGKDPPEPLSKRTYNGKLHVRMSPELHRALVARAAEQGIPINRMVVEYLAKEFGQHSSR